MSDANASAGAQPCIWMSAGLLTYKLCDRDFDCENCPLDAALSGHVAHARGPISVLSPSDMVRFFPADRLYSPGHSWLQSISARDGLRFRFGIDAFAATIMGHCRSVSCYARDGHQAPGQILCEIDLGLGNLFIVAPIAAVSMTKNKSLDGDPNKLITEPYGAGWIADLEVPDRTQGISLLKADAARERARLDLRRFRRQVALQLLADTDDVGLCLADGGELADLRRMLGGAAYMELVRGLIH